MEQPELPLATRAPTPPSPEGIAGFGRGGSGRRSAGAAGPGPAAGQPPPRSSPAALILKGASAQPAAHPIPSHPRPGPSRSPPPAPRRPGPAVTPGRSGRCWAVGEAQENTLLRGGGSARSGLVFFFFLALGNAGPVRTSLRRALISPSGKPGRRPRLQQSCAGKRGTKGEFRLDPLLSLPSSAGWSLAGYTLMHCRPSLRAWLQGREGTWPLLSCLTFKPWRRMFV